MLNLAHRVATPVTLAAAIAIGCVLPAGAQEAALLVTADWLLEHRDDVHVLHLDASEERFLEGHIPGAAFVAFSDITWDGEHDWSTELRSVPELEEALEAAGVSDDAQLVVYAGDPRAAARMWLTLDYLGHGEHASVLNGGLAAWSAAGGDLSTEATGIARGELTPRPREDMVVSAEWIHERLDDPNMLLLDARPADEYTGADGGMGGMANPGHIPGAVHFAWDELIVSSEDRTILPASELRARFAEAGATEDRTLVTYCMIGYRASLTYFAARLLGYDIKFYDGSWHDWGTRDDLPHVTGDEPR